MIIPAQLRGFLKFLLAISIPSGLVWLVYYAQTEATRQTEEYDKQQKERPMADKITIDNYALREVDENNQIRWQLTAKTGILEPSNKDVNLTDIKVEYFNGKVLKMRVVAPIGTANEVTHDVKLLSAEKGGRVICEGDEGKSRLEADKIELGKKNQFKATGGVNIVWPGVAKVSGSVATGTMGKKMDNIKISGNTHATIGKVL